tara:strand:+ start:7592 stop:7930 length:339 start_codon:yes stop_codon:yes gene_type:complete
MPRKNDGEPFNQIDSFELNQLIKDEQPRIIDVRELEEYETGHIKSSELIPLHQIEGWISKNKIEQKVIFVCQMGVRSALACEISSAYGVDDNLLFNLEGGMNDWIINGFEIE